MDHRFCPECHAQLPPGQVCRGSFDQMITWDFEDFTGAGRVHHLTVLCYYIQHPSLYSPRALKQAIGFLREIVTHTLTIEALYHRESQVFSSTHRDWTVSGTPENHGSYPHPITWTLHAPDIVAGGVAKYPTMVEQWAQSIYDDLQKSGNLPPW